MRFRIEFAVFFFGATLLVQAQTPAATRFEVASIRESLGPGNPAYDGGPSRAAYMTGKAASFCMVCISGIHYDNYDSPLKALISAAYKIDARLLVAPDWINQAQVRFTIHATMPEGSTKEQIPDMLRSFLEERFHLVVHRATVEQTGYALVVGKSGPKLKEPGNINVEACDGWRPIPVAVDETYKTCTKLQEDGDHTVRITMVANSAIGPGITSTSQGEAAHHEYFRITMPQLVGILTEELSSGSGYMPGAGSLVPVVDHTGIEGPWRVVIDNYFGNEALTLSVLNSALEKQGLRLEKTTAPAEKLFVDRMDKMPTEN